jgi:hypothetical protein
MNKMTEPIKTNLVDSSFESPSFTLGGDNTEEAPRLIEWDRSVSQPQTTPLFITDKHIGSIVNFADYPGRKVALLIEPPSLNYGHYQTAFDLQDHFDAILTFNEAFFKMSPRILYFPLGGSWIAPQAWSIYPKTRKVSIITSQKHGAPGHQLRHQIAATFPAKLDRYGRDFNPVSTKRLALASYRFSVVVESIRMNGYFSEKLIDCLACGTTPIYWGAPDIHRWFPGRGIVTFGSFADLTKILSNLASFHYANERKVALMIQARSLRCAEDRIFTHYKWIWDADAKTRKERRADMRRATRRPN